MTHDTRVSPASAPRRPRLTMMLIALLATMLLGSMLSGTVSAGQQEAATPVAPTTPVETDVCDKVAPGIDSMAWIRSELYFGTTMPDGTRMSPEDWQAFLDEEITPRFPDGLTVLEGYGQWLDSSGVITAEDSIVLIIFLPYEAAEDASVALEEIREAYKAQFDQESVLRADSGPVCISF